MEYNEGDILIFEGERYEFIHKYGVTYEDDRCEMCCFYEKQEYCGVCNDKDYPWIVGFINKNLKKKRKRLIKKLKKRSD